MIVDHYLPGECPTAFVRDLERPADMERFSPCPKSSLASRNEAILCPKGEIDRDTAFYQKVHTFRNERAEKNLVLTKLYIPGNIIQLVDVTGDGTKYVPYWASRCEWICQAWLCIQLQN